MKRYSLALIVAIVFSFCFSFLVQAQAPDWNKVGDLKNDPNAYIQVTETLFPGVPVTNPVAGGFSRVYAGHSHYSYCNKVIDIQSDLWSSTGQYLRTDGQNLDFLGHFLKPGLYQFEVPLSLRYASNGDVETAFYQIFSDGSWDAPWYEFPGKVYPDLANELNPQIPLDIKYKVVLTGASDVATPPGAGWQESPAGDTGNKILFKNSLALHSLEQPVVGFDLYYAINFQQCNTVGDYPLVIGITSSPVNMMWWTDPSTGGFDMNYP